MPNKNRNLSCIEPMAGRERGAEGRRGQIGQTVREIERRE